MRLVVDMPKSLHNDLNYISEISGMSKSDVFRRSIRLFKFLSKEEEQGGKITIINRKTNITKKLKINF